MFFQDERGLLVFVFAFLFFVPKRNNYLFCLKWSLYDEAVLGPTTEFKLVCDDRCSSKSAEICLKL